MKKILFLFFVLTAVLTACQKSVNPSKPEVNGGEICFNLAGDGMDFNVSTKASEVSSISSIYWEASNAGGVVHSVSCCNVSSGSVSTGKYWPSGGATYGYKVSNVEFTTSTGTISASNGTDIVCGTASGVTGNTCSVTLDHIFARTATLTLNTQEGYTLSDVSWKIKSKGNASGTAGTYTIGTGWGSTATTGLSEQSFTSTSDLYLIPGTYTVTVSYTLSKGAYSESFTKSADVSLAMGKKNSITGTASGGSASEISFSVNVASWGTETIEPTFN